MPKQVHPRWGSPFSTKTHALSPIEHYRRWLVEGAMKGVLNDLCLRSSPKKKLTVRWLECACRRLTEHLDAFIRSAPPNISAIPPVELMEGIASEIQRVLSQTNEHSYLVLNKESDLLLWAFHRGDGLQDQIYDDFPYQRPYDEIARPEQRVEWLMHEVPEALSVLYDRTTCLDPQCVSKTSAPPLPPVEQLHQWASTPHAGALRNEVLGYYHGLDPATVKRLLSKKTRPL